MTAVATSALADVLEEVHCPICGRSDYAVTRPAAYPDSISRTELLRMYSSSSDQTLLDQLVCCRSCGMQYVSPRVRSEIILASYRDAKDETHWEQGPSRVHSFRQSFKTVLNYLKFAPSRQTRILD